MIRSKGEAGTGNVVEATGTCAPSARRSGAAHGRRAELFVAAKELQARYELVRRSRQPGKLPVVLFTPAASPRRRTPQ